MDLETLNIGVIGTGFIGKQHIEAIRRIPGTNVCAIADRDEEMAKKTSELLCVPRYYTDYRKLIEDDSIDVIHNCTPSFMHLPISKEAILKGKHIYCEKPLALNTAQSYELLKVAEENNVATGVNFNYRHNAVVQEMREKVATGFLGKVLELCGEYLQDWLLYDTDFDWRLDPKMGGESRAVADIGSHCFDTAQFIMGQKIVSVYAHLMTMHPTRKRCEKSDGTFSSSRGRVIEEVAVSSEDAAFIIGKFEDGTSCLFNISQVCAGKKNGFNLTVSGSLKSLAWHQERCDMLEIGNRDEPNQILYADAKYLTGFAKSYAHLPAGHAAGWHDALTNGIRAYYESIWDGSYKNSSQHYVSFEGGHQIMKLVEACLESHKTGEWVNV